MKYFRNNTRALQQASTGDPPEAAGLVEKAANGDSESFGELYNIYLGRIYRYVFYQVRDKMAAEDITGETFFKAWRSIGSCRGKEQTFLPWLYRIARNNIVDSLRSRSKQMTMQLETLTEIADPNLAIDPPQERQELLDLVSYLPENQKQVIILKFLDGRDNEEIGRILGKSQGAVRILQMRALDALRNVLGCER